MMVVIAWRGRLFKLKTITLLNASDSFRHLHHQTRSRPEVPPMMMRLRSFKPLDIYDDSPAPLSVGSVTSNRHFGRSPDSIVSNSSYREDGERMNGRCSPQKNHPPNPIPNRPLRAEKPIYQHEQQQRLPGKHFNGGGRGGGKAGTDFSKGGYEFDRTRQQSSRNISQPVTVKNQGESPDFLEKFKLGFDRGGKQPLISQMEKHQTAPEPQLTPPQGADEIFKKMKETGLIPNAVAMLHGLCQDGLVQEAMKLFGLMREKGTIPEVVIYTAVVEGFCIAQKLDDAKRIFRKMQNNGISPNAFSYAILIQGLYKGKSLDDALDFCLEMLEAGHSPNLATFTGLVDGLCREKGLEEAQCMIATVRQKGFFFDEKALREYLDKKGPFIPLVWEAILGKKSSQKSF